MPIEVREAVSDEIRKSIKTVKAMSGSMGFDENMSRVNWKAIRAVSGFGYMFMPKEKGVKFRTERIAGVKCLIAEPTQKTSQNIILYIHGGGFVSGGASSSKGYCSMLAKYGECAVIAADYSLSPESKYPTALGELVGVYNELCARFPTSGVSLVGESAGASLCLAVTLKLIASGSKKPLCVIAHSPFVDFCGSLDRTVHEVDDFTVKAGCLAPLREIYVGSADPKDPFVSPLYGDYKDFPPLFITCDSNETLYADALAVYQKASGSGVNVKMIEMKNSFHAFATLGTGSPETMLILKENIAYINKSAEND